MSPRFILRIAVAASLTASSAGAHAAPPLRPAIVIFGGGWGPEGTQQSLERQVVELAETLRARSPTVLFADGTRTSRAVQIAGPADEASALLGLVFNQRRDLYAGYRAAKVAASGPASRKGLLDALNASRQAPATFVFGVGHGSPAEGKQPAVLELWGPEGRVSPEALAAALDSKREGPTAFVLGQCHSGAFTPLMFSGGRPGGSIARPARCVFAAAPADREAAGCTTDLSSADANAYMAQVTEALKSTDRADYDGNGHVSLAEAHAYARIHDPTVDVPVSSSARWLAATLEKRAPDIERLDLRRLVAQTPEPERTVLRTLGGTYVRHADGAARAQRAYRKLEDRMQAERKKFETLHSRFEDVRERIVDRLLLQWPELANPYHATSRALLAGPAPPSSDG